MHHAHLEGHGQMPESKFDDPYEWHPQMRICEYWTCVRQSEDIFMFYLVLKKACTDEGQLNRLLC